MDNFYVFYHQTIPVNIFRPYFRTKLATTLELEHDKWEVGLVEISYPKGYKKRYLHNTLRLGSDDIIFPVKHLESVFDLLTNIPNISNRPQSRNLSVYLVTT